MNLRTNLSFLLSLLIFLTACQPQGLEIGESTETPAPDAANIWLESFTPEQILVQLDYEPTFFRPEASYPFGRMPSFTLYANGLLIYQDEGASFNEQRIMFAMLTSDEVIQVVRTILEGGFEELESHIDDCLEQDDGTSVCIADASYTIMRVMLPDSEMREVVTYANFSNNAEIFEQIQSYLRTYSHPAAELYVANNASLFISVVNDISEVDPIPWPLDTISLQAGEGFPSGYVLGGTQLETFQTVIGGNTGDYFFEDSGNVYRAYLVPWLPYVDYTEQLADEFPTPTPAPIQEPIFEIAENAQNDLALLLGISADQILVAVIEQVEWPDGCLGIPFTDRACAEATVPGFRLLLDTNGQRYEYRANYEGSLLLYGDVEPPQPIGSPEAILILSPGPGSRIVSPLYVSGEANPTFEQNLVVRVILADGLELALVPVTIQADIGQRGPFEVSIPFELNGEQQAFIQVYAISARDGGITHLASTSVLLADTGEKKINSVDQVVERIRIDVPHPSELVSSGIVHVAGFALASFEQTLIVELLDAEGNLLAGAPLIVQAPDLGMPGLFSVDVPFSVQSETPARVVVRDPSVAFDGDVHLSSVEITLIP